MTLGALKLDFTRGTDPPVHQCPSCKEEFGTSLLMASHQARNPLHDRNVVLVARRHRKG